MKMRTVDIRFVVEADTNDKRLVTWLGREIEECILGAALLENNGFGHMLPSTEIRAVATPPGDPDSTQIHEAIDKPDLHR